MTVDRQIMAAVVKADMAVERILHTLPYIAAALALTGALWLLYRVYKKHER